MKHWHWAAKPRTHNGCERHSELWKETTHETLLAPERRLHSDAAMTAIAYVREATPTSSTSGSPLHMQGIEHVLVRNMVDQPVLRDVQGALRQVFTRPKDHQIVLELV